jgi:hypothetical protein
MIKNPEVMRQLVNGRLDYLRHDSARGRIARRTRRARGHHRMQRTAWYDRGRTARAPEPATA